MIPSRRDIQQSMPGTIKQLVKTSGYGRNAVSRAVKWLRANKEAHIGDWLETGARPAAIYFAGPGNDVRCTIKPLTKAERWKRSGRRPKFDPLIMALFKSCD